MVLDIRAEITSNLGDVITANLSDSYLQGSGLITTQGSCIIDGIVTPSVGDIVTFSYTKNGITRNIPRKTRVLSSFADPYRRTTQIELGCKLTYMSAVKDPILWTWENDPENIGLTRDDSGIVIIPISAFSVANRCLHGIGITTAPGSTIGVLNNKFSIKYFDYSSGYVSILANLLVSESYFGYLNFNEQLVIVQLTEAGGTGPVLNEDNIIDIRSINSGEIPGDVVYVNYNTQVLSKSIPEPAPGEEPDPEKAIEKPLQNPNTNPIYASVIANPASDPALYQDYQQEKEEYTKQQVRYGLVQREQGQPAQAVLKYKNVATGVKRSWTVTHIPVTETFSEYQAVQVTNLNDGSTSLEEEKCISESTTSSNVNGITGSGWIQSILTVFGDSGLEQPSIALQGNASTYINKVFEYGDSIDTETEIKYETAASIAGQMNLPWAIAFADGSVGYVTPSDNYFMSEKRVTKNIKLGEVAKTVTYYYNLWHKTQAGANALSNVTEETFDDETEVLSLLEEILTFGCVFDYATISESYSVGKPASIPPPEERILEQNKDASNVSTVVAKSGYSNLADVQATGEEGDELQWGAEQKVGTPSRNDTRQESQSALEFITGNQSSGRATEFTLPYADDDRFVKIGDDYFAIRSSAAFKANRFGRIQNKLLLGNRSGMNITTVPEFLPDTPFSPVFVEANGLTAMYRMNGTSWVMDSSGVLISSDALFWGGVGGTGTFWFPVAPGIVSLGSTPPVIDGEITVSNTVPVWQEVIVIIGRTRSRLDVATFPYSLTLLTEISLYSHHELKISSIFDVNLITYHEMTVESETITPSTSLALPSIEYSTGTGSLTVIVA